MNKKLLIALIPLLAMPAFAEKSKPNILMIAIDDLNDWTGVFGGAPQAKSATPRMDKFAQEGAVVFQRANCAGPVCCPSRSALLSGFMPNRTGVYGNSQDMLDADLVKSHFTLPEYFSKHGYQTLSTGKIFHGGQASWAFDEWYPKQGGSGSQVDPEHLTSRKKNLIDGKPAPFSLPKGKGNDSGDGEGVDLAWGPTKGPKEQSKDWKAAEWAIEQLSKPSKKTFFLSLGISKPHLPWFVPQEYFDRFPLESIKIPEFHLDDLGDIVDSKGKAKFKPTDDFNWVNQDTNLFKRAVQAYLASASHADDCVGIVLDALAKSKYADNTIVIIWGDHGWHLGEKLRFRKATLWAESTRVPLLIRMPGMKSQQDSPRLVNLMDLYPTLIDLCGLPPKPEIDGRSIAPLLRDPKKPWPYPSITVLGEGNASVHDERWYFIRYEEGTEELYDMDKDPLQLTNLATSKDPEIISHKARLAASFPASFAGMSNKGKQDDSEKDDKSETPDETIKPQRAAAQLK
jgi:arylsulfatase A-like enzyme